MTEQTIEPTITEITLPATIETYDHRAIKSQLQSPYPNLRSKQVTIDISDLQFADEDDGVVQWEYDSVIGAEGSEVTLLFYAIEDDD